MTELKEWNWETQEREWGHANSAQVARLAIYGWLIIY